MNCNGNLKHYITSKLESAGDARLGAEISELTSESRSYIMDGEILLDAASLSLKCINLMQQAIKISKDNSVNPLQKKLDIAGIQSEIVQKTTVPKELTKHGIKVCIGFGDPGNPGVLAFYNTQNNTIQINLMHMLMEETRGQLDELLKLDKDYMASMLKSVFVKQWPEIWEYVYQHNWIPDNVFHELRHALDYAKFVGPDGTRYYCPKDVDIYNKIQKAKLGSLSRKFGKDIANELTQRFNEEILSGKTPDMASMVLEQAASIKLMTEYVYGISVQNYVRQTSKKAIGTIKELVKQISAKDFLADAKVQSIRSVSDARNLGIDTKTRSVVLTYLNDTIHQLEYLCTESEVNARISQYLTRFAMLRRTNNQHLTTSIMLTELMSAYSQIAAKAEIPVPVQAMMASGMIRSDEVRLVSHSCHAVNKAICKRLYTALDAANHIHIDPNDNAQKRLEKMANYMDRYTERKLPNKPRTVTPPPMPRHPKPDYRGGYMKP